MILRRGRSLAATTVENYLNQVRPFMAWYAQQCQPTLVGLTIREVNRFLVWRSGSCSAGSLAVAAAALRTLVRWMFLEGRLARGIGRWCCRWPAWGCAPGRPHPPGSGTHGDHMITWTSRED